ncbi:unnamed protein product [Blepharisma stoltei]|uniref:DUF2007 domain-containing protein n=1 Tax=Blepharisma stoltei TaxID=1481888 RepID=A0AAU9JT13_9CILI|nr:unnamed protein product [Blepharisma stoltei]
MCFSFLSCTKKKKKHLASTIAIAPMNIQIFEDPESSDSLESLRASIGEMGIPVAKERFYSNIGGVLVFKNESLKDSSWNRINKYRLTKVPLESRIKMARDRLMNV